MGNKTASATPFILRLAGLYREILDPLRSAELSAHLETFEQLDASLETARGEMVDLIFAGLSAAPDGLRSRLLAIKRDCFNGRPSTRHLETEAWRYLNGAHPAECLKLTALERRRAELWQDLEASHRRCRENGLAHFYEQVLNHRFLRRGLALASPVLSRTLRKRGGSLDGLAARKRRKLDQSLLRYLTRAAFKTSPYSTLTPIGVGLLTDGEEESQSTAGRLLTSTSDRSFLRARRFQLEQIFHVFCLLPDARRLLDVGFNGSLQQQGEGWIFLRPARWRPDPETGVMKSTSLSAMRAKLPTEVLGRLLQRLGAVGRPYDQWAEEAGSLIDAEAPDLAAGRRLIDRLIDMGALELFAPWPSDVEHLELELATLLRRLPLIEPAAAALDEALRLQVEFASTETPEETAARLDACLDRAFRNIADAAGLKDVDLFRPRQNDVYEDVVLRSDRPKGEMLRLPRQAALDLLGRLDAWCRLEQCFDYRFDFLHSLAASRREAGNGRGKVPALELFATSSKLWRQYQDFLRGAVDGDWRQGFNPFDLPAVTELVELRRGLWRRLKEHARERRGRLDPGFLAELAERVPDACRAPVGPCLFLQPTDPELRSWVVNRVFEGTGRYSARFVALLDEEPREDFLAAAQRGEPGALRLDLMWNRGDSLNTHGVQTEKVLLTPGDDPAAFGGSAVPVRDLHVVFPAQGLPALALADDQAVEPRFLGGSAVSFLPQWLQFLHAFGPPQLGRFQAPESLTEVDGVRCRDRLSVGDVVLRRRRWWIPVERLLDGVAKGGGAEAFVAVDRRRRAIGLPEQVFWIEALHHPAVGTVYKPQYIDFTAPLLVDLLISGVLSNLSPGREIILEEALPAPASFPEDSLGGRALEIVLDRSRV